MNKFMKFLIAVCLAAATLFALAGCNGNVSVQAADASTQPAQTETATPTPSPTATPSPTPDQSAIAAASEKAAMEELDKQIKAFLNKESPYGEDDIQMIGRQNQDGDEYGDCMKIKLGLVGLIDGNDSEGNSFIVPCVEGLLFDYVEIDNNIYMIIGFDDQDGNRFVTPIEIPMEFYNNEPRGGYPIVVLGSGWLNGSQEVKTTDPKDIKNYLNQNKGDTIALDIDIFGVTKNALNETGINGDYFKDAYRRIIFNQKLIEMLSSNGFEKPDMPSVEGFPEDVEIIKLESADSIKDFNHENTIMSNVGMSVSKYSLETE